MLQHFAIPLIVGEAACSRGIETPRHVVEVGIVVEVCAHVVGELLQPLLLFYEIFALSLERRGLGLDSLEGVR
jgi:hypothetical protein